MKKLYVTNLIILNPSKIGPIRTIDENKTCRMIEEYKTEDILVEETLFGYREVFTKHHLKVRNVLERNYGYESAEYPNIIKDEDVLIALEEGRMQFVLDADRCFFREAEEKDAKEYIAKFENSALNRYYSEQQSKTKREKEEKKRKKESRKKARQLVKVNKIAKNNG